MLDSFVSIENFLHLRQFRIRLPRISAEDIWKVIQNYRKGIFPLYSYFQIFIDVENTPVTDVLKLMDVEVFDDPVYLGFPEHTQRFAVKREEHVLVVAMRGWMYRGAICHRDTVDNDCWKATSFMNE